jgi:Concanavalin A-like lectin/glucanases superfamily
MNWSYIILGVIIVILLYVLYLNYFSTSKTKLSSQTSLNSTAIPGIAITDAPTSTRYAYGIWIYVNTWNNTNTKPIFSRPGQISVYLDNNTPTLYCDISQNCTGGTNTPTPKMSITQNFPIQKWTYITVNVDNQFVDMYLDGKLVKSIQMQCMQTVPPKDALMLLGGTAPNDILVTGFHRWSTPLSPQDVWSQYMAGNGVSNSIMSSYGAKMVIMKDAVEQSTVSLF